jgi:hypothetical protein
MEERAKLHKLIDELPEAALEATFRVLENYQRWPPKGHADAEQMIMKARERFTRQNEKRAQTEGRGFVSGSVGGGSFSPDGHGYSSFTGWEGHTSVTSKVHYFRGREFHSVERLRLSDDGRKVLFSLEIKTPSGTAQHHDFSLELDENGS